MDQTDIEMTLLREHLEGQRKHALGILEGLSGVGLRQSVLPSGWHCLGMVKHLTSVERYWFRCVVGGAPLDILPVGQSADWQLSPTETAAVVFGRYRQEIDLSDEIIAATGLVDAPKQPDPVWVEWGLDFPDLRSVMMHVITEIATHAGHLDAARELIDGRQWLVLD